MNANHKLERKLLEHLRNWRLDPDKPSQNTPFVYPDSVAELECLDWSNDDRAWRSWQSIDLQLDLMEENGWISVLRADGGILEAKITPNGLNRLEWHEEQDTIPRLKRFAHSVAGTLITSLILPFLVAILTTLAVQEFTNSPAMPIAEDSQ